jgi:integrase
MRQILDLATARGRGKAGDGARWLVVVSLIAHETLREHEICALDLDDLDVQAKALTVVRKKQSEPSVIPLSARTWNAMRRWVARRGRKPGPLIWGSELRAGTQTVTNRRLTPDGVYHIVHALGLSCELSTSPHKLRHTAITVGQAVRERLGIPLQDAMARAGHMSVAAHERYLDADLDNVRRLSDGVADALHDAP